MGKCQTDPLQKANKFDDCYAGGSACCPTLCCPACFGPSGRIPKNLDLIAIYFETGGLEFSKKNEIHSWPCEYQGSVPCEEVSQKVVKSIEFLNISLRNIAFRLGKIDILCFLALSGMPFDHFKTWPSKKTSKNHVFLILFFGLRVCDQKSPTQKLVFCAGGRRVSFKT